MTAREINFDGLIGPSHNYAGLSLGNLASARNAGAISHPRAAALQGIEKMRSDLRLGLAQGLFLPQWRPDGAWLAALGTDVGNAEAHIRAAAMSASSMWAANAATVSPAPDTADRRTHLTVANLVTMPHRSHEWPQTLAQLRLAFSDRTAFAVHGPIPAPFGDEGAANHMRLCDHHGEAGVEVFVYGQSGGPFPARQHVEASKAVARLHRLDPDRTLFVMQSEEAIAAGAFHNDVVAVANERVLFAHEQAFADKERFYADLRARLPSVEIVEVPASAISLSDAIRSYIFNAQLVTLPDGIMALVLPTEARDMPDIWSWLEKMVAGNGPIRKLVPVDVRQSMANGGGPACLRLRVVADPANIDPRFLVDEAKLDGIAAIVREYWPEAIAPDDLADTRLIARIEQSWLTLVDHLRLSGDLIP
ncbi:succinylarginine dihydrolase [Sphingobium indicum IP26]|uniref:N-succinylarginine dihydrolase n=1 Tax=Sphingobium indicum F2 TaxID=1450518 RepID=A0A8E0WVR0_9SPHN|nr:MULTISPECIES: N-succinylarginine dihydrolase [Sphingobium]EPR09679.1 succinylarginine dihydrolase [Sphingobium indicum IP26]EQB04868.1 succinylarginine dihydrolase [Sphingobium sp. HDIP04]KER36259.1 succinylarginine dihydrolase [Sphingobium indicum F2]KER38291.1 succinylarginine dihydrolase [Sphingobium indicum F2]